MNIERLSAADSSRLEELAGLAEKFLSFGKILQSCR
jgi:hypothetical protein